MQTEVKIRVRYAETDKMGYSHHGNYASYFEIGRTELLRQAGLSYRQVEESGIMLPVRNMNVTYYKPAFYDDLITISTRLKEKPAVRLIFEYEIHNEAGELLCKAETTLVFVDAKTRKPCRAPKYFLEKVLQAFPISQG